MRSKGGHQNRGGYHVFGIVILRFDAGLQFGIGAQAPRVSIVAGFVVGIADLYGK
jgi:hypothetical protein